MGAGGVQFGLSGCGAGFESARPERWVGLAQLAERHGFSSLWINEEHFQRPGNGGGSRVCLSPIVLAAALAARTRTIRIGFSVLVLPLHQPLRLAEEVASLDVLSGGRMDFGVARGGNRLYLNAFGVTQDRQTAIFRSALASILRCWGAEPLEVEGRPISIEPKPVQQPHPPVYVGAYSDESIRWLAAAGHTLIQHGIQSPASLARCLRTFAESGGERKSVPVGRFIYVGETDASARREVWPAVCQLSARLLAVGIHRRGLSTAAG